MPSLPEKRPLRRPPKRRVDHCRRTSTPGKPKRQQRQSSYLIKGVELAPLPLASEEVTVFIIHVTSFVQDRSWDVSKRYSDFKELEERTWAIRGPMPPFPHTWEDLVQILLHFVEPIIQRRRKFREST